MKKGKTRKEAPGVFKGIFDKVGNVSEISKLVIELNRDKRQEELAKDSVIVRPMKVFSNGEVELLPFSCEKTPKDSYMIRAICGHKLCTKKWVLSSDERGVIGFCNVDIDADNLIGFRVEYVSEGKKKMMFLAPIHGTVEELKEHYEIPEAKEEGA